jgi:hypothetical protein
MDDTNDEGASIFYLKIWTSWWWHCLLAYTMIYVTIINKFLNGINYKVMISQPKWNKYMEIGELMSDMFSSLS